MFGRLSSTLVFFSLTLVIRDAAIVDDKVILGLIRHLSFEKCDSLLKDVYVPKLVLVPD